MTKSKLALALIAAMSLGIAGRAHAWVQFCNGTDVTISTTYERYDASCAAEDGSVWKKAGWWTLAPGQCKIVYGASISNRYSYYYAHGGGLVWEGPYSTCVPYTAFAWCDNLCSNNARYVGFRQYDTGGAANATLTFNR